jgi:uncharacterized membrane protein YedE/YeeE
MDVVVNPSSWLHGLLGGALIGLAAAVLFLTTGRVAGISGIFGGLVFDRARDQIGWRALFIAGLLAGPLIAAAIGIAQFGGAMTGWAGLVAAGFLVGFGTRLGNGCTSGHGICGLARFSRRSFAATITFMAFGFLTVYAIHHLVAA